MKTPQKMLTSWKRRRNVDLIDPGVQAEEYLRLMVEMNGGQGTHDRRFFPDTVHVFPSSKSGKRPQDLARGSLMHLGIQLVEIDNPEDY